MRLSATSHCRGYQCKPPSTYKRNRIRRSDSLLKSCQQEPLNRPAKTLLPERTNFPSENTSSILSFCDGIPVDLCGRTESSNEGRSNWRAKRRLGSKRPPSLLTYTKEVTYRRSCKKKIDTDPPSVPAKGMNSSTVANNVLVFSVLTNTKPRKLRVKRFGLRGSRDDRRHRSPLLRVWLSPKERQICEHSANQGSTIK